jgi:F0F1-type ATP synthase membrane subunit b/b'
MAALVEDVVSLEKEADVIVAQARTEAKELEKLAIAEAEAYRRKKAEETEQRVVAFQEEMEEKYRGSVAETEKDLTQALNAIDQIADSALKEQINRIVAKFGEL